MNWNDLPSQSAAQVEQRNLELAFFGRRVYPLAGGSYVLRRGVARCDALALAISYGDIDCVLGLSTGLLQLLLEHHGAQNASAQWLQFLVPSWLGALLPSPLLVKGVVAHHEFAHTLVAYPYGQDKPSPFAIGIDQTDDLVALFSPLDHLLAGLAPPAFANAPISLPLVASSFEVPANDLATLQLGDVFIL